MLALALLHNFLCWIVQHVHVHRSPLCSLLRLANKWDIHNYKLCAMWRRLRIYSLKMWYSSYCTYKCMPYLYNVCWPTHTEYPHILENRNSVDDWRILMYARYCTGCFNKLCNFPIGKVVSLVNATGQCDNVYEPHHAIHRWKGHWMGYNSAKFHGIPFTQMATAMV